MLKIFVNETFKEVKLHESLQMRYAISNFGRMISFMDNFEDGRLLKGSVTGGFRLMRCKTRANNEIKYRHYFFYKLVAENFLPPPNEDQKHLIHLDYNLGNDAVRNLKWVTREEMLAHNNANPSVIKARQLPRKKTSKLTTAQVMLIKKKLADPNRKTRIKILAKQFGVSEMQLYRIKSGENWGDI